MLSRSQLHGGLLVFVAAFMPRIHYHVIQNGEV